MPDVQRAIVNSYERGQADMRCKNCRALHGNEDAVPNMIRNAHGTIYFAVEEY